MTTSSIESAVRADRKVSGWAQAPDPTRLTQEAMNGELVIAARFADSVEVPITLSGTEDVR